MRVGFVGPVANSARFADDERVRVVIIFNPKSGGGRGAATADVLGASLHGAGTDVASCELSGSSDESALCSVLAGADAALIVGGDGTVHSLLPVLARTRTPMCVVPTGTENLFARQFGMTGRELQIRRALAELRITEVDLGECNGRLFSLMCGVGFDGAVIGSMAAARRGPIRRWSYIRHVVAAARSSMPTLAVEVDGRVIVADVPGSVVVANARGFAVRSDPADGARMDDGLLDVVFMPASTGWGALAWLAAARLGKHRGVKGLVYATGTNVRIATDPSGPAAWCQFDGEAGGAMGRAGGPGEELEIVLRSRALRVILP